MKVAIYVRVSTEKQDANNQIIELRNFCQKSNWEIYYEYVDIVSGKENSRPAFDKMFVEAHMKKFDMVLFWALDRFSRSGTLFTLQKLKELENLGIAWKSYSEPYFDSLGAFKDVVLSIMATLAKLEREKISERTKAGLNRAILEGKIIGRPKTSKYLKDRCIEVYFHNKSISQTSKEINISYGTAWKIIKDYQKREGETVS